jgi:hypothetical protein
MREHFRQLTSVEDYEKKLQDNINFRKIDQEITPGKFVVDKL